MIKPHGGVLVNRLVDGAACEQLLAKAGSLPKVALDAYAVSDIEMIAIGGFSPLEGFMTQKDFEGVVNNRRLANGLVWTIPVTLAVDAATAQSLKPKSDVALTSNGQIVAILHIEDIYKPDKNSEAQKVLRTTDASHPGVARLQSIGEYYLGGKISVVNRPAHTNFQQYRIDPVKTREQFAQRGWKRIVGFQTRNPIHRAHEFIQKGAMEVVDGMLLHPLVGETKSDDVSATVRMKSYEVLLQGYYPKDRVILAVNPSSMRYGGPSEAIFHALIRKNYGCTHFVVGRDHAGVGKFYGTYDAQKIFDEFTPDELGITPLFFENSFWCNACGAMASTKTCPHGEADRVSLSGTKVRELLMAGQLPPKEVSRPEVAKVLIEAMRQTAKQAA
jgi:sulfate adenylyltransferase